MKKLKSEPGLCPDGDCGLYVVARLAGISIPEARKILGPSNGSNGGYTIPQLSAFLAGFDMMLGLGVDMEDDEGLKDPSVITFEIDMSSMQEFFIVVDGGSHAILWKDGVVYDPNLSYPPDLHGYSIHQIWPVVHHDGHEYRRKVLL